MNGRKGRSASFDSNSRMFAVAREYEQSLRDRLSRIYGDQAEHAWSLLKAVLERHWEKPPESRRAGWSERDIVLITYGDQVHAEVPAGEANPSEPTLATLRRFLLDRQFNDVVNSVHLLPFFPYSSDDGFSVIDFRAVDPRLGTWSHVQDLGADFRLAFDLVLNHISRESAWFQSYLRGEEPYVGYFIEADPDADYSEVVRPRSLPLLTPVETSRGLRHVWTTFSDDQIDLNFADPRVMAEMIDVLLFYVQQGARIIRLDAIAYLWKELGTKCIHLPETHEVVKLMRDAVESVAPGTILLTETNVPHAENISYFGDGDEAQMVYQFPLAPLLLDGLLTGDAGPLRDWAESLGNARPGTTYFNFTASHDGVGVRPLEGLVPPERFERLVAEIRARGGLVSMRKHGDGSESPYELNCTYLSALAEPDGTMSDRAIRRFLASQAFAMSLQGIPGVYFHSLIGAENDLDGVAATGRARSINRRKFSINELQARLSDADSTPCRVLAGYRRLLATRIAQPAFHPDAAQTVHASRDPAVIVMERERAGQQRLLVLSNFSDERRAVDLPSAWHGGGRSLLREETLEASPTHELNPYEVAWIVE